LHRHIKAFKESGENQYEYRAKFDVKKVFNDEEKIKLNEYLKTVAKMQYVLTKRGVRKLAYKFALANNKKYPSTWDDNKMAGEEWMRSYLSRHGNLSIRKPQKTSLARASAFNKHNLSLFYNNLEDIHKRFGPIPPERIWKQDETGLTTVLFVTVFENLYIQGTRS